MARTSVVWVPSRQSHVVYTSASREEAHALIDFDKFTSAEDMKRLKETDVRKVILVRYRKGLSKLPWFITALQNMEALSMPEDELPKLIFTSTFRCDLTCLRSLQLNLDSADHEVFKIIASFMTNLRRLELRASFDCDLLRSISILEGVQELILISQNDMIIDETPDQVLHMPCVTKLHLENISLGDSVLHYLTQAFPNLTEFVLYLDDTLTEKGMRNLSTLKQLRKLAFRSASVGTNSFVGCWSKNLVQLRALSLIHAKIRDSDMSRLAQLPELEELHLTPRHVSGEGWKLFCRGRHKVRYLDLVDIKAISNDSARYIGRLRNLERLSLQICNIWDSEFLRLCENLQKLKELEVSLSTTLSNAICSSVALKTTLKSLTFHSVARLTDSGLNKLKKDICTVEKLSLVSLNEITNSGLIKALPSLIFLKELCVLDCAKVTEDVFVEIVENCADLVKVRARMSEQTRWELRKKSPFVEIVREH